MNWRKTSPGKEKSTAKIVCFDQVGRYIVHKVTTHMLFRASVLFDVVSDILIQYEIVNVKYGNLGTTSKSFRRQNCPLKISLIQSGKTPNV